MKNRRTIESYDYKGRSISGSVYCDNGKCGGCFVIGTPMGKIYSEQPYTLENTYDSLEQAERTLRQTAERIVDESM